MELALSTRISSYRGVRCLPSSHKERLFVGNFKPIILLLPCYSPSRLTLVFSRRRNHSPAITSSSSKKKKKKKSRPKKDDVDDDSGFEDDPFEALFSQLEEDLENDDSMVDDGDDDDDDEINEEDIDKLARELEEALGDIDLEMSNTAIDGIQSDRDVAEKEADEEYEVQHEDDDDDDEEEEEEEERQVRLKNWQLRKLAYALKTGRRKTSIKNLAAELCLDRALVLELLHDPPPNLLMMSAALPDEPTPTVLVPEVKPADTVVEETVIDAVELATKVKEPVHARQHRWFAQKRLKKVQVKTLELVYRRSKRPTNAMISSIVQVTNLPRRRIVQWFEDKRAEEGVPNRRVPYQRSDPETVFSS